MRRAAWRSQGVVVLRPEEVRDDWTRQALIDEGEWAPRPPAGRRDDERTRPKPHKVRGREFEEVRERDPDGRIVYHHRTVDTLGKMLRAGTIDQAMHDAAKDFQAAFIVAQLDPLRALPILRVPGTGREPVLNERQLHALRRVHQALEALGGISEPGGLVRVACGRPAEERPRVGNSAGVGWSACAAAAGAGNSGRGARGVGGALRA